MVLKLGNGKVGIDKAGKGMKEKWLMELGLTY